MLNTLKTNLILTRAVLIALFAGLFILAACGGGSKVAPTTTGGGGPSVNPCDDNAYGEGCDRTQDIEKRTEVFGTCRDLTTTRTGADACENVPEAVINCLDEPFLSTCNQTDLEAAGAASGAFLALQRTRVNVCRGVDTIDDGRCTRALQTRCFAPGANPNIFDTLCSKSSVERDTIIAKCAIDATVLATDADCAPARDAADAGFACFENPWASGCADLPDFARHLAVARTNRATYCADTEATGFNSSLCETAMASVCVDSGANANPFSALCTDPGNASVQAAFARNCYTGETNGASCTVDAPITRVGDEALCGNGDDIPGMTPNDPTCATSVNVETCANSPFNTTCRPVATFAGARSALLDICTNGVIDGQDTGCSGAGFSADELTCIANPFTDDVPGGINCGTLFTALGGTVEAAQNTLIAVCTGADGASNPNCNADDMDGAVATCLDNPFDTTTCDAALGATQAGVARTNILTLCTTADSDNFRTNDLCTGLSGNVETCLENPFTATETGVIDCAVSLGDTQAVMRAQANLSMLCFSDSPDAMLCTDELKMSQFCTATADPFHANCDDVAGIDAGARTAFCTANAGDDNCTTDLNTLRATCSATPFAEACLVADSGYADNRERAIRACTNVPEGMRATHAACTDVEVKAEVTGENAAPAVTLASCFAEPFQSACADDAFDTVKGGARFVCGNGSGQEQIDACAIVVGQDSDGMNVTVAMCEVDPLNSACADKSFDTRRNTRVDACLNAMDREMVAECDDEVKAMVPAEGNNPMIPAVTVEDCIDSPFSADCTNAAFDNARGTLESTCRALEVAARTTAECITPLKAAVPAEGNNPMIPAVTVATCIASPFSADCTNAAFDSARGDSYQACQGIALDDRDGNANCDAVVVAAVTGENAADAVTVADCVADPFATGCVIDEFKLFRDTICGNSIPNPASFNTGCTEEDYSEIATTRAGAIPFCRNNPTHESCAIAVSGDTDAPTVGACATNPFTAGCDAELFNTAERQATYCEAGKVTIFDTNCDTRTGVQADRAAVARTCLANSGATVCTRTILVEGVTEVKAIAIGDVIGDGLDNMPNTADDDLATINDVVEGVTGVEEVNLASCVENPWLSACRSISSFDSARFAHTEVCMRDGLADDTRCMTLLGILTAETATDAQKARAVCITDPFAATCTGTIYSSAKTNRYAFCRNAAEFSSEADKTLCGSEGAIAGTNIVDEICSWDGMASTTTEAGMRINPIAGICDPATNVDAKRYYCGVDGRRASETACDAMNVNTADGCLANPFSAACKANANDTITTELRDFLETERTSYCTDNVADEDFQATLCQTVDTNDNDFASLVCQGQGEMGNPFANFCVRDGNGFDAARETFVQACAALVAGTELAGGATCTPEIIACNADAFGAGCADESAYASLRQTAVNGCVAAVATNSATAGANADCMKIDSVGQLTCITENPYLNRADVIANDIVTMAGLNCLGNSSYDMLRTTLETVTCLASGTPGDTRCSALVANVCGTGTGDTAVVGTNPFNTNYCSAANNTFDTQRKALIDSCDGTSTANGCTAEINACVNNPFATSVISTTGTETCQDASVVDFFDDRKVAYCGLESTDADVANISLAECRTHAVTTLAGTNPCIANPFGDFDNAGTACDDTHVGGDITDAQTLRATYCATRGSSLNIRTMPGAGNENGVCRGAIDQVCKDDALFDQTGTGYDCFNDKVGYNTARETHAGLCDGDAASRSGVECTLAKVEICTTPAGLQTNPFAPICTDDLGDPTATTAEQRAVINACLAKTAGTAAGERGEVAATNICTRALTDAADNSDVVEILATCDGDPRLEACNPFAATVGEGYAPLRLARYALSCASAGAYVANADLCPEQIVKTEICKAAGDNARPFASICSETGGGSTAIDANDLKTHQNTLIEFCQSASNATHANCTASNSATAILDACGSAATKNPFSTGLITGFTSTAVNCAAYTAFNTARETFEEACRTAGASSTYTATTCNTDDIVADVCTQTTGARANPFSSICSSNLNQKRTFADLCVGKAANEEIGNGNVATCPADVATCANRPLGSTCGDDGYNVEKTEVLTACNTGALIVANASGSRCDTAIIDELCLRDPANCTTGDTVFAQATGGATAYLSALITDRLTYCNTDDNINAQKNICRSDLPLFAFCTRNPWSNNCDTRLGGASAAETFRDTRLAYCRLRIAAELRNNTLNVVNDHTAGTLSNTDNFNLCFTGANINSGAHDQHAVGAICAGTDNVAVATQPVSKAAAADPFSAVCREFPQYNDLRLARLGVCAGFASPTATSGTECNWAAQVTLCAKTTDNTDFNAQCGTLNTALKWQTSANPPNFTNGIDTTVNQFVRATTVPSEFEYLDTAGEATGNSNLTGAHAGSAAYGGLPNVTFFSARKAAVNYTSTDVSNSVMIDDGTGTSTMRVVTTSDVKTPAGPQRFYATINNTGLNVGRPVFNRNNPAAVWTGQIHWIGDGTAVANHTGARTFKAQVNFAERTIEGAVSINTTPANAGLGNHLVIDGDYTAAGIITGTTYIRNYNSQYNSAAPNITATASGANTSPGVVSGIIGHRGAVGAFISGTDNNTNGYAGGFVVCSADLVTNLCPQ